jgi:general secretion pathway protein G
MTRWRLHHGRSAKPARGFTLLELIVAATILSILTLMALPLARVTIQREKEKELRRALWEMRDAIDKYEQASERGAFQIKADSFGPVSAEARKRGKEEVISCQSAGVSYLRGVFR